MCIPKNAQNKDLAHEYINFMCSHDIAMANALYTYYASPVTTVLEDPEYQEAMAEVHEDAMEILYSQPHDPTKAYLNLSSDGLSMMNILWEELKAKSSIGDGIYIGCGLILAILAFICVYQLIKKRRWAKLYD
jgi:spermidine/putrescine-binding protein